MITISREKLKRLLHAATNHVKDFVINEDDFIDTWLNNHNPKALKNMESSSSIAKERQELDLSLTNNSEGQLWWAASCLSFKDIVDWDARHTAPEGWDLEFWQSLHDKPHKERLIIAGALIAAELDRIQKERQDQIEKQE